MVCWSRTVVPRPVNIEDFEDRARPMGRPRPSQALTTDHFGGAGDQDLPGPSNTYQGLPRGYRRPAENVVRGEIPEAVFGRGSSRSL
jgi:hypothetical protein